MVIQLVSLVLLSVITIIILMDLVPICKDWLDRIKIGRYAASEVWSLSITRKGVKWLNKTPKIKVTDNTRLVIIDMLKGNYTKKTIQHWQEAALILGLAEYLKYNRNEKAEKEVVKFLKSKFNTHGEWINKPQLVDGAILAYAVMKLEFIDTDKYKKALDTTWKMIKEHIGEDGTVGYRKSMGNYRYVDTIGFICPFLVAYGIRYHNDKCVNLAIKQITDYERHGILEEYYLPVHAYKLDSKEPIGIYGWGRGLGWFTTGLIDSWNELPENNENKKILEGIIRKTVNAVISFQQENGSWNWTVTRNECRSDSSVTAMLGWFMLNVSKIEGISNECLKSADKSISYLMKVTRRNGVVDFSQGDTKDIGVYSMLFNILPFTQGFCIRIINLYQNIKK
ncbi:glycoside hydrolase family 88 protein [Bacillus mycoides]|uniref:glycoside hydrolase family 88 protein n=1 Tax=Bacillus mycoides TaxID=1405 RepID=UPI0011A45B79|nr:glycoside hydrolase family 88 protein [Bacillus mycoides]